MAPTTLELHDMRPETLHRSRRARTVGGPLLVVGREEDTLSGALRVAELLARRDRVNAHVLSLVQPLSYTASRLASADAAVLEEGNRQRQNIRMRQHVYETVGRSMYFSTGAAIASLGPACAVARAVRRRDSAFVITGIAPTGTPARSASEDLVLEVARTVATPVLAVSHDMALLPKRALVAVDFGEGSIEAARAAVRTMAPGGTLTLAHVLPDLGGDAGSQDGHRDAYTEALATLFSSLSVELGGSRRTLVHTVLLSGDPVIALAGFLADHDFDLVAAGTRSTPSSAHQLTGRVSTGLVRGATSAVLLASPTEVRR